MIEITLEKAIESAKKAVERRGADYVYEKQGTTCLYVHPRNCPECMIGCMIGDMLINDFGVDAEALLDVNDVGISSALPTLIMRGVVSVLDMGTTNGPCIGCEGNICTCAKHPWNDENNKGYRLPKTTRAFLNELQYNQDRGRTWGEALQNALYFIGF